MDLRAAKINEFDLEVGQADENVFIFDVVMAYSGLFELEHCMD